MIGSGSCSNQLPRWQRRLVVGSAWALAVSGVVWLPFHYLLGAGAGLLPHPAEPWVMRCHGLAVVGGLFAAGLVAAGHVRRGWQLRVHRRSGLVICAAGALTIATGYLLAYLVPEAWHPAVGWTHAGLGLVAFGAGTWHWARRARPPKLGA